MMIKEKIRRFGKRLKRTTNKDIAPARSLISLSMFANATQIALAFELSRWLEIYLFCIYPRVKGSLLMFLLKGSK